VPGQRGFGLTRRIMWRSNWGKIQMGDFRQRLRAVYADLISRQEPLGDEFSAALYANREELYVCEEPGKPALEQGGKQ